MSVLLSNGNRKIDANIEREYADVGRFKFDLAARNLALDKIGVHPPKAIKTGTTIVAATYPGGVVLGADSRATGGNIVADKYCVKVHYITDHIYACGAGTAADLDQVCRMLQSHMRLYELNNPTRRPPVIAALRKAKQYLFRYQGHVGAYLIIGGVDADGSHLYTVAAHGSTTNAPFAAEGSGSLAAMSILEAGYAFDMDMEKCKALVSRALEAGMHGDWASGNTYRLTIVTNDGQLTRLEPIAPKFAVRPEPNDIVYDFKRGTTAILREKKVKFDVLNEMTVDAKDGEKKATAAAMETD